MSPAATSVPPKLNEVKPGFENLAIKEELASVVGLTAVAEEKPSSILERALVKEEQPNDLSSTAAAAAAAVNNDSWAPESVIERHEDPAVMTAPPPPSDDSSRPPQLNFIQPSTFESHPSAAGNGHSPVHPSFAPSQDTWMR